MDFSIVKGAILQVYEARLAKDVEAQSPTGEPLLYRAGADVYVSQISIDGMILLTLLDEDGGRVRFINPEDLDWTDSPYAN